MDWIGWLILAVILIGGEIFSGSFYLLPFGLASLVAAIVAFCDFSPSWQYASAALMAILFWILIRKWAVPRDLKNEENPSNTDIGKPVHWVESRLTGGWRVRYRGTEWDAVPLDETVDLKKKLYIVAQEGNILIVDNQIERTEN